MAAMSDYLENKIIDWLLRGQAFTPPATVYVGFVSTASTDSTPGTEFSGGSYARVAVSSSLANWAGTQAAASTTASSGTSGTTSNNANITFPAPTSNWGTAIGVIIMDAATGGNMLFYAPLITAITANNGGAAPVISPTNLQVQID